MKTGITPILLSVSLTALLTVVFTTGLHAQTSMFTYQGQLADNGAPASGSYDLRFTIYDLDTGGTEVGGPITNTAMSVSNGAFTTTLDFGPGVFDGTPRWLEIGVATNGSEPFEALAPRQFITSAPYAIQAANAASAVAAASVTGNVSAGQLTGAISSTNIGVGTITSSQLAAGAVTSMALADGAMTADKAATVTVSLALTTLTNPTPTANDYFGWSVAMVGSNRVLVGAWRDDTGETDAGAAYLFSTDGALLTTFTNPTPAYGDYFGHSVAAVGTDRVLIGADGDDTGVTNAGTAYLFSTDGALLTTITNPTPADDDNFAYSVAVVASDRLLIGAFRDDTGATDAGTAYLFSTNGALLTTVTNPAPADGDNFAYSVAVVASDRLLIGAHRDDMGATDAGAAYLFSTNGALLTTFTNPAPADEDRFGRSVAAVGGDRVLIGAFLDDAGATDAGTAYLFSTDGALLTTITNPTPTAGDWFGHSVAALGTDGLLIGAFHDDTGATDAGAVYLFGTNGALRATFTNPIPAASDWFGLSVVAAGTDQMLIGARREDVGATAAGAVFLFRTDTYTPGLVADGVRAGSITSTSIGDGAVTLAKLDPTIGVWTCSGDDLYRLTGNVGIGTANPTNKLQVAGDVSGTTFITTSDRNAKENLAPISPLEVLRKVTALPISTWNFKESKDGRHMGPMAQDFKTAFDLGNTTTGIATVDADGVALAAIQGLNQKVQQKETEITELKARLERLEQLLNHKLNGGAK